MKTMDGVNITVGMRLFWRTMNPDSSTTGFVVSSLDDEGRPLFVATVEEVYFPAEMGLYSTRDAGRAARWARLEVMK